jgi:hypothetical protein
MGGSSRAMDNRSIADIPKISEIPNTTLTIVNVQKFKMFNME